MKRGRWATLALSGAMAAYAVFWAYVTATRPLSIWTAATALAAIWCAAMSRLYFRLPRSSTLSSPTRRREQVKKVDVPPLAWKWAYIVRAPSGELMFQSLHRPYTYGADDDADCAFGFPDEDWPRHGPVPSPSCVCGHYALKQSADQWGAIGAVLLQVELSGRIIVHKDGYRAQHVRVLAGWMGPCSWCLFKRAEMLIDDDRRQLYPICSACLTTRKHIGSWRGDHFVLPLPVKVDGVLIESYPRRTT